MQGRHFVSSAALVVALFLAGGCSYGRDLMIICESPSAVEAGDLAPEYRQMELARYLDRRIRSPSGRNFFEALAPMNLEDRANALEAEARSAGLERCELVEYFREMAATDEPEPEPDPDPAYEVVTPPDP